MYDFFKIRQKNKVITSPFSSPKSLEFIEYQATLWAYYPTPVNQTSAYTSDQFWQNYEVLLAQAKKKHPPRVIQKASNLNKQLSKLPKKQVFRSQSSPFNFIGLLTDLVVAVLVAPSQEAILFFCLVVSVLYFILALLSFTSAKHLILEPKSLTIRNYWSKRKQHFLFSEVQSISFYSRKEDNDKLYIETFDMEFCVDVNIRPEKIKQLFCLLHQKGITINATL